MKFIYWTLYRHDFTVPERLAVIRENGEYLIALGEAGTRVRRLRVRCGGKYDTAEACKEAQDRLVTVRREFRQRREALSVEKFKLRKEEHLAQRTAMGPPP